MSPDLHLIEHDGYTDASAYTVMQYSNGSYRAQPGDVIADPYFDACVVTLPTITRKAFSDGRFGATAGGVADVAYGFAELANRDGRQDARYKAGSGYSYRERPYRQYSIQPGAALATRTLILRAAVAQAELSRELVTIHVKDRLYELDTPHITTTYAGNNALPLGVEGSADLLGKQKPKLYGAAFQIEPPLNNTSKLIYQINDGAILSATMYDKGQSTAFTVGADYSSEADMIATAPSSGEVRYWKTGGMFRLGSSPAGRVTVDATAHSAGNSTAAQLIKTLCLARGVDAADINAADVTALDTANSAVCGLWVDDDRTTRAMIDLLAASVGAYVGFDEVGVLRMSRFAAASGTPAAVIGKWGTTTIDKVAGDDDIPFTKVRVKYARYGAPLNATDAATSLTAAVRADLAQQWRISESSSTPSPNPFKRANTIERETALAYKADADAEAARLLALYQTLRGTYLIKDAELDSTTLRTLGPNSVVEVRFARYGFSAEVGTLLRVIGITKNYSAKVAEIIAWG